MSETEFKLAGQELDGPIGSAAGITNHPDIEFTARKLEELVDSGIDFATLGSWTVGDTNTGNAYRKTEAAWVYDGGDEYIDIEKGKGYNAKSLPNAGTDIGMDRLGDLLDIAKSGNTELALSFSPHSGDPVEELKEIIPLASRALKEGVLCIEVNLGCPNLKDRPPFYLDTQGVNAFYEYLNSQPLLLNKHGRPGLYPKVGPLKSDQIGNIAYLVQARSIGGIVTSNTFGGEVPLDEHGGNVITVNNGRAGMSGPALKDSGREQLSLWVGSLAEAGTSSEVIGVLGVDSGEEVNRRLSLGAAAVQLGSILHWPELIGCDGAGGAVRQIKSEMLGTIE